jgi:hypothetical protein
MCIFGWIFVYIIGTMFGFGILEVPEPFTLKKYWYLNKVVIITYHILFLMTIRILYPNFIST